MSLCMNRLSEERYAQRTCPSQITLLKHMLENNGDAIIHSVSSQKPMRGANGMMDLKKWDCGVPGKEKTLWEGGLFKLELTFPDEYPTKPPKCKFRTAQHCYANKSTTSPHSRTGR